VASEILRVYAGKFVPSAGTIERVGRPLSLIMANQFKSRFGTYQQEHVSSNVYSHMHREYFIVFDQENLNSLLAMGISRKSIMRFSYFEIEDPYVTNQYERVFNQIYDTIVNAV
jgi:protein-tyrosine-phosphatase